MSVKRKRLREVLCERGQISAGDLKNALQDQQGRFVHFGELLLQRKLVSKKELTEAVGEVSGVEYRDCEKLEPPAEVLKLIPAALARRCLAIPVRVDGNKLVVVMAKPQNVQVLDELQFKAGLGIAPRQLSAAKREPIPVKRCRTIATIPHGAHRWQRAFLDRVTPVAYTT